VKAQGAEREKWNCKKCRIEKVRMLQEKLQNAMRQIDAMKSRNREQGEKLLLAGDGKRDTVPAKLILQSAWWSVTQCCSMLEQNTYIRWWSAFRGLRPNSYRVIENRDPGSPETVIIHVGTNELRTTR
jgi:hypothetical protein